jgi:hypothetical protein
MCASSRGPTSDTILMADSRRSAARALAVRTWPGRRVHQRCQEPVGGNWVTWPGFDKLWANILPRPPAARAGQRNLGRFRPASDELVVDYRSRTAWTSRKRFRTFHHRTERIPHAVEGGKGSGGHYRGAVKIGSNQGLFRIRPLTCRGRSGGRVLPPGRRNAGSTATTNSC